MLLQYYVYVQNWLEEKLRPQEGQDLAEYALLVGLIAILVIAALTAFKGAIIGAFNTITTALSGAVGS